MGRGRITNVNQTPTTGGIAVQLFVTLIGSSIDTTDAVAIVINGRIATGGQLSAGVHVAVDIVAIRSAPMGTSQSTVGDGGKGVAVGVGNGQMIFSQAMDQTRHVGLGTWMTGLQGWKTGLGCQHGWGVLTFLGQQMGQQGGHIKKGRVLLL